MSKYIHTGECWIDKDTGEVVSEKTIQEVKDQKIVQKHNEYVEDVAESNGKQNYKLVKVPDREPVTKKIKEGFKFNMIHRTDLKKIMLSDKLSVKEKGFIGCLTPFISFPDNDVKINHEYLTMEELAKFVGFSKNVMTKVIKVLENEEIIKVVRGGKRPPIIYFNPFLYCAGRETSIETYNLFAKSIYNPEVSKSM